MNALSVQLHVKQFPLIEIQKLAESNTLGDWENTHIEKAETHCPHKPPPAQCSTVWREPQAPRFSLTTGVPPEDRPPSHLVLKDKGAGIGESTGLWQTKKQFLTGTQELALPMPRVQHRGSRKQANTPISNSGGGVCWNEFDCLLYKLLPEAQASN